MPNELTEEELQRVRANREFWRLFMPKNTAGVRPENLSHQGYINIIDALLDMVQDAAGVGARHALTFHSKPTPYTAEDMLRIIRAHFELQLKTSKPG